MCLPRRPQTALAAARTVIPLQRSPRAEGRGRRDRYTDPVREHHRPVLFGEGQFERLVGAPDPAVTHRIAHETARTLLSRARGEADENVLKRLTHYTDEHGLETIAELWAASASDTLPGVLWRVWVLRALVMSRTMEMTALYDLGVRRLPTADPIVTGSACRPGARGAGLHRAGAAGCVQRRHAPRAHASRGVLHGGGVRVPRARGRGRCDVSRGRPSTGRAGRQADGHGQGAPSRGCAVAARCARVTTLSA